MAGFGTYKKSDSAAERALDKSVRELRMLRKVINDHPNDPKGRAKMMKKMKKYWSSNLAAIQNLDYQVKGEAWRPQDHLTDDIKGLITDPRVEESESIDNLTEEDMSSIRDMISKDTEDSTDDQPGSALP
jgi:hypothetical protein